MSKKKSENKQKTTVTPRRTKRIFWVAIAITVLVALAVVAICLCFLRPIDTKVSGDLDACIVSTLRSVHYSHHTDTKYPAVAYTPLCVEEGSDTVTVYGVMMYREYTCTTQGEWRAWVTANDPFVITVKKTKAGYEAVDCWWPKNGQEYVPSIEEKFPRRVRDDAVNPQQYYAAHDAACKADAEKNIAAADKYVVWQSELGNVRLAYCPNNDGAYIIFGGGYSADGTYSKDGDNKMRFTLDETKVQLTFAIDGDHLVYNAAESADVPKVWQTAGNIEYLKDGVIFKPDTGEAPSPADPEETAPVGPAVTVSSMIWLDETGLRELFGQYLPQSFDVAAADDRYLPVRPVETRDQLDRLIEMYADAWSGLTVDAFVQYDEAFFENNYLMMTYYRDGYASCEPKVDSYVYVQDGASLWLSVRLEVEQPAVGDTVVGQWLLFSGIAKEDYKKATSLEAYVENVVIVEDASTASTGLSFTGTVTQVEGHAVLMSCDTVPQFSSGVWVELGDAELDPQVGDAYTVTYEDIVMPSLPPRITAITITKP